MKIKFKLLVVCLLAIIIGRVCLSKEKKDIQAAVSIPQKIVEVQITPKMPSIYKAVNTKIFGVNIGFALARELDKDSGFVQLLRAMHPSSLRFPGGTVANWYHPNLPVYGYKKDEIPHGLGVLYHVQSKRNENILYNYIRLSKAIGSSAVFCANVLTGTIEETLFVLDELKKNKIPILGVELGNEFNLLPYREKEFTSGTIYANKVKATAQAIRSKYPELKIAIVGADLVPDNDKNARSVFMRNWNKQLAAEHFFDAYVWHFYANCETCDADKKFDSVYLKNVQNMAPFKTDKLTDIGKGFVKIYGKERKFWMTEWNISNTSFLENTFTQAAYVFESFLKIIDINAQHNNYIEITHLHAMDALINPFKGKIKPVFSNEDEHATVQYFAFKFLANTLTDEVAVADQSITCASPLVKENFICKAFVRKSDQKVFLHFLNRSGSKVKLKINGKSKTHFSITSVDADVPYATAGKTIYEKDYPSKVKPIYLRNEQFKNNSVSIAPFSFGYIEYDAVQ